VDEAVSREAWKVVTSRRIPGKKKDAVQGKQVGIGQFPHQHMLVVSVTVVQWVFRQFANPLASAENHIDMGRYIPS